MSRIRLVLDGPGWAEGGGEYCTMLYLQSTIV